jgi:hypothetical protein
MLLPEELTTGVIELIYFCIATENTFAHVSRSFPEQPPSVPYTVAR